MKINDLDPNVIGKVVLRLAPVSHLANHIRIKSTLDDYVNPNSKTQEAEFVRDLFVLKVPDIIEKWYGGEENAHEIIAQIDSRIRRK